MELLVLRMGDPRYDEVIGVLVKDVDLRAEVWQAAESRLDEHAAKTWVVACEDGPALAWCAYEPAPADEPVEVKAVDSYERPEVWGRGLYAAVYRRRQKLIRGRTCVTYVFDQPLGLHLADGWERTGDGWSEEPDAPSHHWTRLVWTPRRRDAR